MSAISICTEVYEMLHGLGVAGWKITPIAFLRTDLGLDSLDRLQIAIEIENKTGCPVSDSEMDAIRTVADLQTLFDRLSA